MEGDGSLKTIFRPLRRMSVQEATAAAVEAVALLIFLFGAYQIIELLQAYRGY